MFTLCHAEYIVFMEQGRLSADMRSKMGMLRLMRRSGAHSFQAEQSETVGYLPGYEGYKAAVEHVYAMFNLPADQSALDLSSSMPPKFSKALSKSPSDITEYVAELWNTSTKYSESTFSALYFFTTVWSMEVGNVNGFHLFPLRCSSRQGDNVVQQIAWRQALWAACISQLVSISPLVFSAFVTGIFPGST